MFPHSLWIIPPCQSTKSLLVIWMEAQEHKYPGVVEEEEIIGEKNVLDHIIPCSKVGDYSGPNKTNKGVLGFSGNEDITVVALLLHQKLPYPVHLINMSSLSLLFTLPLSSLLH